MNLDIFSLIGLNSEWGKSSFQNLNEEFPHLDEEKKHCRTSPKIACCIPNRKIISSLEKHCWRGYMKKSPLKHRIFDAWVANAFMILYKELGRYGVDQCNALVVQRQIAIRCHDHTFFPSWIRRLEFATQASNLIRSFEWRKNISYKKIRNPWYRTSVFFLANFVDEEKYFWCFKRLLNT